MKKDTLKIKNSGLSFDMKNSALSPFKRLHIALSNLCHLRHFPSEKGLWIAAMSLLAFVYFMQFLWVRDVTFLSALKSTLVNIIPVVILGLIIRLITRQYVIRRPILQQFVLHALLAMIFTHAFYLSILIMSEFQFNWLSEGLNISPFYASATKWQLMQGIVIYAAILGLIYGYWIYQRMAHYKETLESLGDQALIEPHKSHDAAQSIFLKSEGEYIKIEPQDLIHIEANGDHVKLHTRQKTFTSNNSLNTFADQLEDFGFIRAHRSHLVNLKFVLSAEPTGDGRLSIHLSSGKTIIASRNGSQIFRKQAQ